MLTQNTESSILVGGAAIAAFLQQIRTHPAPQQLIQTGLTYATEAVGGLSPTSTALPILQLFSALLSEFFPPATPAQ